MYWRRWLSALLLGLTACASHPPQFVRFDGSRAGLDTALADCRHVAETAGLDASQFGRRPIVRVEDAALMECMSAKGWTVEETPLSGSDRTKPGDRASRVPLFPRLDIPPGFNELDTEPDIANGLGVMSSHVYGGPHDTVLAVVWQQNPLAEFGSENFPVPSGFWRYTEAREPNDPWEDRFDVVFVTPELTRVLWAFVSEDTPEPRWTVFYAVRESVLVGGVGAYLPLAPDRRLVLVVTTPLSHERKDVGLDRGRDISASECQALEAFAGGWIKWMRQQAYRLWARSQEGAEPGKERN
ncbi:hypothetical protein [Desulfovibrio inopinatus]|uniref:hypothetical protein n=1 Tax=Desulfovibrio inopinatus TaxID=102109 RepID=UPI000484539C|nr:hypothetical protein [Desulfovibrio inopinatus]